MSHGDSDVRDWPVMGGGGGGKPGAAFLGSEYRRRAKKKTAFLDDLVLVGVMKY
jgi:hypothetical protein